MPECGIEMIMGELGVVCVIDKKNVHKNPPNFYCSIVFIIMKVSVEIEKVFSIMM